MKVSERFSEFTRPGYFCRVDSTMIPELYIGLDDNRHQSIELREKFTLKKVPGTSAIEVTQFKKPEYNTIRFSLKDDEITGLFYKFCDDLIEQASAIKEKGSSYNIIVNRYFQWKKMFVNSKKQFLTEPEIMGLIGEITFLRGNLARQIGLSQALDSWSGQELTHKDFSFNNQWFEVKTITSGNQSVRISSIEQLESDYNGELVVFILEKMSENYNGITLNKIFDETCDLFDNVDERDRFRAKVCMQGYEYNSYYDSFVYEYKGMMRYLVDTGFPKLSHNSIPRAITKASYEISLNDIAEFMIRDE